MVTTEIENTPEWWTRRAETARFSWEAAGWSHRGQTYRFERAVRHLPHEGSVLDWGCGTGRFSLYVPAGREYVGYDSAPGMIERARREHPGREFTLEEPPRRRIFDSVVSIGVFNLKDRWQDPEPTINQLWAQTRRTLIVSLYRGDDPLCVRYLPSMWAQYASVRARRFVIDAGHLDNDFLLVMHR